MKWPLYSVLSSFRSHPFPHSSTSCISQTLLVLCNKLNPSYNGEDTAQSGGSEGTEAARSKAVVFLHGFPEIWYTWRHQMIAVADAGYRAIAFDFRGYGLSEHPAEPEKETMFDLVPEIVGLLDALNISKAFLVGKDFGAFPGYLTTAVHPERVAAIITLGIPFMLPGPSAVESHALLPKGFYITRWREPGRAEADFDRFPVKSVVRNIYTLFSRSEIPIAADDQEIMDLFDPSTPLPPWFSEEDLATYASLYEKSGFRYALQVPYRSINVDPGLSDVKVTIPALLIMAPSSTMEKIQHSQVEVKGLKLHVAEIGSGSKAVVFLHGFPEIWYTWRHQMIALANAGYRAIAFDFRGYGDSEHPAEPEKETIFDLVPEIVGLLDSLNISKAFLVGKDFGAIPGYLTAVMHPERVAAVITLGIPFLLPRPSVIQSHLLPKGFYVTRWQEPGRAEADFGRFPVKSVIRNIYTLFSRSEIPIAADDQEIMDLFDPSIPLPPWFSEEDLATYASLYEKSGFRYALQVPYRSPKVETGLSDGKVTVTVPALLIMGEKDYVLKFPGMEDYIRSGEVKNFVPDLEIIYIPDGSHFVHEQFPENVNKLIIEFLDKQ
ncbi:Bifunctional epoxide hydrolase 2, partial [Mucuna pruriens]